MGLPGRTEQHDHPDRWHAGAVLSYVFVQSRLGYDRSAPDGFETIVRDETRVRAKLLFDAQSHSGVLLQRRPCAALAAQASRARIPGRDRKYGIGDGRADWSYREGKGMQRFLVGLDVGSTTVKCVVRSAPAGETLFHDYRRHEGQQAKTVLHVLRQAKRELGIADKGIRLFM